LLIAAFVLKSESEGATREEVDRDKAAQARLAPSKFLVQFADRHLTRLRRSGFVRGARQRSVLDDVVVNALERHSHRLEELIGQAIEERALNRSGH
jgi:hypothetical protein